MQWVNWATQPAFGTSLLHWWATPTQKLFWFIQAVGELPVGAWFPGVAGWVSFKGHVQLRSSYSADKWFSHVQAFSFPKILMHLRLVKKISGAHSSTLPSHYYHNQNYSDLWYYCTSLPDVCKVPVDFWKSTKSKLLGLSVIDLCELGKHQNNW